MLFITIIHNHNLMHDIIRNFNHTQTIIQNYILIQIIKTITQLDARY